MKCFRSKTAIVIYSLGFAYVLFVGFMWLTHRGATGYWADESNFDTSLNLKSLGYSVDEVLMMQDAGMLEQIPAVTGQGIESWFMGLPSMNPQLELKSIVRTSLFLDAWGRPFLMYFNHYHDGVSITRMRPSEINFIIISCGKNGVNEGGNKDDLYYQDGSVFPKIEAPSSIKSWRR